MKRLLTFCVLTVLVTLIPSRGLSDSIVNLNRNIVLDTDRPGGKGGQFTVGVDGLSGDQKRCVSYALKQWVMYDTAPISSSRNKNTGTNLVMGAGGDHSSKPVIVKGTLITQAARSIHYVERKAMIRAYGKKSPFHKVGDPVVDPTDTTIAGGNPWFTSNAAADLVISVVPRVPGESAETLGKADYGIRYTNSKESKGVKGKITNAAHITGPAQIYLKSVPNGGKNWYYAKDDFPPGGDGWITNRDKRGPPGTEDFYAIVKHELGHYFSFKHDDKSGKKRKKKGSYGGPSPIVFGLPSSSWGLFGSPGLVGGSLNSAGDDGGPSHSGERLLDGHEGRLFLHSDRPGGFGGTDIWFSSWGDSLSEWGPPVNCGPEINTAFNERDPQTTLDDALLYFASDRPGGEGGFDIFYSVRTDTAAWDTARTALGINSIDNEMSPQVSGGLLYFASDRPGGFGGFDIWRATVSDTANFLWTTPIDMPLGFNSASDEIDPFVFYHIGGDTLGALYFSSNRSGGFGGLDIYDIEVTDGVWSAPSNLGPTVNDAFDQLGAETDIHVDRLYFETTLPGGVDGTEIVHVLNLTPRHHVIGVYSDEGAPGDSLEVGAVILNTGLVPISVVPLVTNDASWPIFYDPSPIPLLVGESVQYVATMTIPGGATFGDSANVAFEVDLSGETVVDTVGGFVVDPTISVPGEPFLGNSLRASFPNPFSRTTRIEYTIGRRSQVLLQVFDISGRLVRTLIDEVQIPDSRTFTLWDGRDTNGELAANGIYFYRLEVDSFKQTRKMVLLK